LIFLHGDVQHPVEAVLDAPMLAGHFNKPLRGQYVPQKIVSDIVTGLVSPLPTASDAPHGLQAWPLMGALQPVNIGDHRCLAA